MIRIKHIFLAGLMFLIQQAAFSQQKDARVNTLIVSERPLVMKMDSLGNERISQDSVLITIQISFSHVLNEISEVHLELGDDKDRANGMEEKIYLSNKNRTTYLTGMGFKNEPVSYGRNLYFEVKRKAGSEIKWAGVSYTTAKNVTSQKNYFKIKD